jgi:hypothetical protein
MHIALTTPLRLRRHSLLLYRVHTRQTPLLGLVELNRRGIFGIGVQQIRHLLLFRQQRFSYLLFSHVSVIAFSYWLALS